MLNTKVKDKVLLYASISQNLQQLSKYVGKDTSELVVASAILTMSRKNILDKEIAKRLLQDTKLVNFIDMPFNSKHIVNYNIIK
jgi:proline dehydrogenase